MRTKGDNRKIGGGDAQDGVTADPKETISFEDRKTSKGRC